MMDPGLKDLLMGLFQLKHEWILSVMGSPKKGYYDESLNIWRMKHYLLLKCILLTSKRRKFLNFLKKYCAEVVGKGKVFNQFKFWTGKWKFLCKLKKNMEKPGEYVLPLARFKLGKPLVAFFSLKWIFIEKL